MSFNHTIAIKIDGTRVSERVDRALQECVVEQNLYLPDMFTIRFLDNDLVMLDSGDFGIGKTVEIATSIGDQGGGDENTATLIKGEITAVEPFISADKASELVIRGYHKSWRQFRGSNQKTFLGQKDDEVIKKLGSDGGVSMSVDSTSTKQQYLAQDAQSSGDYWTERSQRIGMKVFSEGGEDLSVKKANETIEAITLELGKELMSFEPRATAAHQVSKVTVRGWDPQAKKEIVGEAGSSKTSPNIKLEQGYKISGKLGDAELTIVDQPPTDAADAKAIAEGTLDKINSSFVQAEGVAIGAPQIMPGKKATLDGIGATFNGDYMITSAEHVYSNSVFETTFTVTGLSTNTFTELLNRQEPMKRWNGVYPGLVTNNEDPDNLNRAKVLLPWMGEEFESHWARITAPSAGKERGFYFLPEIDDEVLVAFEHGDITKPYIIGSLWNGKDKTASPLSEVLSGGKVNHRVIKSRTGHTIILDDTDSAEMIKIFTKSEDGGHTITMDDAGKTMTISSVNDAILVTIDGNDGSLKIKTDGDITIESKKNIKIDAKENVDLQAGKNITVKGGMSATLEGSKDATVKGAMVSVNGSGQTEIKGGVVKIN